MKIFSKFAKPLRIGSICVVFLFLNTCVGTIVGVAVDTTIEVVKVPFKVVGAVVDLAIPDGDDDD